MLHLIVKRSTRVSTGRLNNGNSECEQPQVVENFKIVIYSKVADIVDWGET